NVKIDRRDGRQPTISGLSLGGGGGHGFRAGRFDIETREVETVARTLTVQSEFKLVDTSDNHIVAHYSPDPYSATDRTRTSLLFGTSRSEAELAPSDRIILSLVRRAAREFVCGILPCNISVSTVVEASPDEDCLRAVKMLRAEAFEDALRHFRRALYHHPDDHRAAYGAGVTCEALGLYDRALRYYRRACAAKDSDKYITARDRMKRYAHRARP
ncbi:MAG: tetratricopeptide repeat protein, partial [Phycisphaerae bacterium]